MPIATNGEVSLFYQATGDGPPILLIHGYTADSSFWSNQVDAMSPSRKVLAPDLRGHGESSVPDRTQYTFQLLAADAIAVLDDAGIEKADLIGHSLGGMIAAQILIDHGPRIRSVVFNDTSPLPQDEGRLATLRAELEELTAPAEEGEKPSSFTGAFGQTVNREGAIGCGELMRDMPGFAAQLRGNTTPSLVIWGADDSANIAAGSAALLELLPNSREVVIDGAGHVPQVSHPAPYNAAVLDFLASVG